MSDNTPVTIPGKRLGGNGIADGVPDIVPFENTGEIANTFYAAVSQSQDDAEVFLNRLAGKLQGGDGNGGMPPGKMAKSIKRHNWVAMLMALILGPGGAVAVIYATSDRSKSNSMEVDAIKPRIEKTEKDVRMIQVNISDMKGSMDGIQSQQSEIANGIQELKQENVNRLKDELDSAKRELRRRRRLDDD